ncbi:MAG: hypothetical protein RSF93_02380, partial [Mucinivorans sp.]
MAKLQTIKKDIAYLTGEVISNCYLALFFQGEGSQESLTDTMNKAIDLHNSLIQRANHPAEKNNARLVRKHYAAIRTDLTNGVDELFNDISKVCA